MGDGFNVLTSGIGGEERAFGAMREIRPCFMGSEWPVFLSRRYNLDDGEFDSKFLMYICFLGTGSRWQWLFSRRC